MDGLGLVVDLAREVSALAYAAKQLRDDCVSLARLVDKLCDVLQAVRGLLERSTATGIVQTLLQDMTKELQEARQFVEKTQTYSFLRLACQSGKLAAKLSGVKEGLTDCMARLMGVGGLAMAGTIQQRLGAMERTVVRAFQAQARKTEATQLEALEDGMAELHSKVEKCYAGTAAVTVEQLQQELQAMAYQVKGKAATLSELEAALQEYRTELAHVHGKMQEMEDLMLAQIISLLDKCSYTDGQKEQAGGMVNVRDSQPPSYLLCPIGLDLMDDPVMLESGHVYDRPNIQEWLDSGNRVCPISRRRLSSCKLTPVYAMRHAIAEWRAATVGMKPPTPIAPIVPDVPTVRDPQIKEAAKQRASASGQVLKGHSGYVRAVAWSPDGRTLATGSDDNTAVLWDGGTGKQLQVLKGHKGQIIFKGVRAVAWSLDGRTLATCTFDNQAAYWDGSTGKQLQVLGNRVFSSAGILAWSPDGRTMASSTWGYTVQLWDGGTGKQLRELKGHSKIVTAVAWSPDGSTLATGSEDKTAVLWDVGAGKQLQVLKGHDFCVTAVAWSPDGRTLATSALITVLLWDGSTGKQLQVLNGHCSLVWAAAWSPDGRTLATGSGDKTVVLWDGSTGKQLQVLKGHNDSVTAVAWSPDGRTLATCSEDNTAVLWDVGMKR